MKRDSVVIYRDLFEGLSSVPEKSYKRVMNAVLAYAMDGVEPNLTGLEYALFRQAKSQIDANNRKFENGKQGGRPKNQNEEIENQTETKVKPNDNQTKPNDNQSITKVKPKPSHANEKCEMSNEKCNIKESKKESIKKETNTQRTRESYESIMDDMEVEPEVRPALWEFIRHCQLNGRMITNSKLTDILVELDLSGSSPCEKISRLQGAIRGGYFSI